MGATFWEHLTPYEATAEEALRRLQIDVFRESGYDLARLLVERTDDMVHAIRSCEEDDPYELLGHYRDCLDRLRQLATAGVPADPAARVALLREIEAISSESAPGVLALVGISDEPAERMVHQLSDRLLESACGTATPDLRAARDGLSRLAGSMDRGSAVCFAVHEGGRPVAWCFAGYSAD